MTHTWTKITAPSLPRSSHSVSVVAGKAYIFGGEIKPRQPVDHALHVVDLKSGAYEKVEGKGEVPEQRVGHVAAVVGDDIYIFGGRGGKEMTPLEENGALHRYSTSSNTWTRLNPPPPGPAARSYHCAAATPTSIIVHAGCPASGRLRDTWSYDIRENRWTQLADAPGDPRGGASIAYHGGKVYRFGGYNGKTELGGGVDVLDLGSSLSGEWSTIPFPSVAAEAGPAPRSVCALHTLGGKLVSIFGEGKPSPTGGHDAAGNFWEDVWAFDPATKEWAKVETQGEKPSARGWFASCESEEGMVLWGGLNGANERLGDGWILTRS